MLWPRWLFLRALGLIYFSAFGSLCFQIRGLIGARGLTPAGEFLDAVAGALPGVERFWRVPTLLWFGHRDGALVALCVVGMLAATLLLLNLLPRWSALVCWLAFLSAISVLQAFASYQSDSMLLEAGLAALFLAPAGLRPGLGAANPPLGAAVFLLRWEWFRIYFLSGVVKLASGDRQWRQLTAMVGYYENCPLPTWIAWWMHQLPRAVHVGCAAFILFTELVVVWLVWLPARHRRARIACFCVVTAMQISIIATANYAFLNYIVLALGFFLLDDRFCAACGIAGPGARAGVERAPTARWRVAAATAAAVLLAWAGTARFLRFGGALAWPAQALAPFRVADGYGLFAVMTEARYEIEFQGTLDGEHWVPYRFRCKPQDPLEPPGVYAPYQPRFEWNLWFASLEDWRSNPWVAQAEVALLEREPAVLALFREDPFAGAAPKAVRTVLWQYWFTDRATRRATGAWWRREDLGAFAPAVERGPHGEVRAVEPAR